MLRYNKLQVDAMKRLRVTYHHVSETTGKANNDSLFPASTLDGHIKVLHGIVNLDIASIRICG